MEILKLKNTVIKLNIREDAFKVNQTQPFKNKKTGAVKDNSENIPNETQRGKGEEWKFQEMVQRQKGYSRKEDSWNPRERREGMWTREKIW